VIRIVGPHSVKTCEYHIYCIVHQNVAYMGDMRRASGALLVTVEFVGDLYTYLRLRK
jgi:hypothetical protein